MKHDAYTFQARGDRSNPGISAQKEKAYCIPANPMSDRGQAVAYGISSYDSNAMKSSNPHSGFYMADTSRTLDLNGGNPSCNQGGIAIVDTIPFACNQRDDVREPGDRSGAVQARPCMKQQTFVAEPVAFNGACITSPKNAASPQPGDPCHTLSTDPRNIIVERYSSEFSENCKKNELSENNRNAMFRKLSV